MTAWTAARWIFCDCLLSATPPGVRVPSTPASSAAAMILIARIVSMTISLESWGHCHIFAVCRQSDPRIIQDKSSRFQKGQRGNVGPDGVRSEEHTSELQSLMRNSYAVFCLK